MGSEALTTHSQNRIIKKGDHVVCAGEYFGTVESEVYPDGMVLIRSADTNTLVVGLASQWRPLYSCI